MRPLRRLMSQLESLNLGDNKTEGNSSVSSTTLMDALEPIDMNDVLAATFLDQGPRFKLR